MADHSFGNIALCILPQSAYGTVNTTITGLTTTVTTADGLVVGIGSEGDADSGITLPQHLREGVELARVGNSAVADTFLREVPSGLSIAMPLAGGRNTASNPTVDGDFALATHFPGMDAIWKAVGLTGAADGSGVGHIYSPSGDATYASIALFFGGLKVVYMDVLVETATLSPTPGEAGILTADFAIGSLYSWGAQTLSTITQGNQSTAAPTVKNVANAWGATRPFSALEITLSPVTEESPDSNATAGTRIAQTGIDVGMTTTIYAATADPDYERDQLILTTANTADMTFGVPDNTATVAAAVCNAYKIALNNLVVRTIKPSKLGTKLGWDVEAEAKAISTAGTEFSITYW